LIDRHTVPGGYVELMDAIYPVESDDGTLTEDSAVYRWNKLLTEAAAKANRRLDEGRNHKQNLIDAGFQNVTETRYKWPINTWPKDPKFKDLGTSDLWFFSFFILFSFVLAVSACLWVRFRETVIGKKETTRLMLHLAHLVSWSRRCLDTREFSPGRARIYPRLVHPCPRLDAGRD